MPKSCRAKECNLPRGVLSLQSYFDRSCYTNSCVFPVIYWECCTRGKLEKKTIKDEYLTSAINMMEIINREIIHTQDLTIVTVCHSDSCF